MIYSLDLPSTLTDRNWQNDILTCDLALRFIPNDLNNLGALEILSSRMTNPDAFRRPRPQLILSDHVHLLYEHWTKEMCF